MNECEGLILQLCVYSISLLTILQAIGFALNVWMIFFFFSVYSRHQLDSINFS